MSIPPRPGRFCRVRRAIHAARTTSAGAQTQARWVMVGSPGVNASREPPEVATAAVAIEVATMRPTGPVGVLVTVGLARVRIRVEVVMIAPLPGRPRAVGH